MTAGVGGAVGAAGGATLGAGGVVARTGGVGRTSGVAAVAGGRAAAGARSTGGVDTAGAPGLAVGAVDSGARTVGGGVSVTGARPVSRGVGVGGAVGFRVSAGGVGTGDSIAGRAVGCAGTEPVGVRSASAPQTTAPIASTASEASPSLSAVKVAAGTTGVVSTAGMVNAFPIMSLPPLV